MKKTEVKLTQEEIKKAKELLKWWKLSSRVTTRIHILLASDKWKTNEEIYDFYETTSATVSLTRKKWKEWWLEYAIYDRKREWRPKQYDQKIEAEVIAIACTTPPEWRAKWTFELLSKRIKEKEWCESFSRETVRLLLKKTIWNLDKKNVGVLQKLTKNLGIKCMIY